MIHAFIAGFAGAVGVLCACWMWNLAAAWRERCRIHRVSSGEPTWGITVPLVVIGLLVVAAGYASTLVR